MPGVTAPAGTIVVITRNRADRLGPTLERLLRLPERWPIIVVDDASTDDTAARVRRRHGERVTLLSLRHNRGAAARTVGVRAAATPFVAFADDDSWWSPGSLAVAADTLSRHRRVGLVAASVVVEPGGIADPIVDQLAASPLPQTDAGPSVLGFLACGAVVRRSAYLDAGGFHPLHHVGGEEELMAIDLRRHGWLLVHVPACVAHHGPDRADAGRDDRPVRLLKNRALIGVMRRRRPACWEPLLSLGRDARHDPLARRALVETVRVLPAALAARRPVAPELEADLRLVGAPASGSQRG
jgi:glycosyltransferase involved in cell wall biosynthesis